MFKIKNSYLFLMLLFVCLSSQAQVKKRQARLKAAEVKVEKPAPADLLYEDMLSSTAKILVIDSIIADKKDFLNSISLNKESGIVSIYDRVVDKEGNPVSYAFINEFGNKMFFSLPGKDGSSQLYSADKLNGQWQNQKLIADFGSEFEDINHPFMMSDGVTLYFSAKSKNGLGGHDIYVTMYDADSARFYKPENIGLPYNSKANDYYYIIDEFNSLGWLVTDRNQPKDKVCIYIFVPSSSRDVYDERTVGKNKLKSLAGISSIKDTWTDPNALKAAREQLDKVLKLKKDTEGNSINFFINDNTVYTKTDDFKSAATKERFSRLCVMKKSISDIEAKLDAYRRTYSSGNARLKKELSGDILSMEKKLETLKASVHELEKEIRNAENLLKAKR